MGDRRKERPDRGGPDQWVDGGGSSGDSGEAKLKPDGLKVDFRWNPTNPGAPIGKTRDPMIRDRRPMKPDHL